MVKSVVEPPVSFPLNQTKSSKMYAAASRRTLFPEPVSKASRLNYEGDVKTLQNNRLGFDISFDVKTGMPKSVSAATQKPYCKVCHDAGHPEVIYTSHYVRASPAADAPVVCPTLLAQPCRYCGVSGHTVKYCPKLAADQVVPAVVPAQQPRQVIAKSVKQDLQTAINRFAALSVDSGSSDEESEGENAMKVDEFDEIKNLSMQTLSAVLSSILQMNPRSDNKLVIAIESAIETKSKSNNNRPPFCSPRARAVAPAAVVAAAAAAVAVSSKRNNNTDTKGKSWADCDDEEIDFNADLPNFPPLPTPSLKRSYSDIAKQ